MENQINPDEIEVDDTTDYSINDEILVLLKQQNELLAKLNTRSMACVERDEEQLNVRADVVDFDMPISTMIGFIFKWFIASIPLGIVIVILNFLGVWQFLLN